MDFFLFAVPITVFIGLLIYVGRLRNRVSRLEGEMISLNRGFRDLERAHADDPEAASPREEPPQKEEEISGAFAAEQSFEPDRSTPTGIETPEPPAPTVSSPKPATPPPLPTAARAATSSTHEPTSPPIPEPVPATEREFPDHPNPTIQWRSILEKLKLWPPSGENVEATIAAWWLTRIGLIILIIAAVFFGIRIAENTPPWVRLLTLATIAAGVVILGAWLERRLATFGRLISAGGLGLGYFMAFAAYGVEATKVIEDPAVGLLVQSLAVVLITSWSLWKDDEPIATMAVLLGYVACWFSFHHDLDHFVIVGLMMLAAGAATLLRQKQWIWPIATATAGSWLGFLLLGLGEWAKPGGAPAYGIILGSFLLLTTLFEAANVLATSGSASSLHRGKAKWLKRLAIANTTLAIGISWIALRVAFPPEVETTEIDLLYLTFAVLIGAFSAVRFRMGHPVAIVETFFLKASGLLALFLVAWFDGPTRWLSLAAQSLIMLWTWRRSRLAWIEAGFSTLFLATLVVILHDALELRGIDNGSVLTVANLVGLLSLLLLSTCLAFHARWHPAPTEALEGKPGNFPPLDLRTILGGLAAIPTGIAMLVIVLAPVDGQPSSAGIAFLSLASLGLAAPAFIARTSPPVVAGLALLLPTYLCFLLPGDHGENRWLGAWLAVLGVGAAELVYRTWQPHWTLGNLLRLLLHSLGLLALAFTLVRSLAGPDLASLGALLALGGLTIVAGGCLVAQSRAFVEHHRSHHSESHRMTQWLMAIVIGISTTWAGFRLLADFAYAESFIALSGGLLFGAAYATRNATPALAGGIPLVAAMIGQLIRFDGDSPFIQHLLAASLLIAVCVATAIALKRSLSPARYPGAIPMDAALFGIALLLAHWVLRSHLETSTVLLGDALLALTAIFLSRQFGFPGLAGVSCLPVLLALAHFQFDHILDDLGGPRITWWLAAITIGSWLFLGKRWYLDRPPVPGGIAPGSRVGFTCHEALGAAAIATAGSQALPVPWQAVSVTGFALLVAALGRWARLPTSQAWSLLPLAVGIIASLKEIIGVSTSPSTSALVATCLVALGITIHGVVLSWQEPRSRREFTWVHGLVALGLAFLAFSVDRLGVESLTTVCWGLSAVVLFVIGLVVGLRPYRLTGLLGLAMAMVRMFIIDIEDPLYRIYAFFAIAVVLLGIGYLYHRFRHLIERADLTTDRDDSSAPAGD